MTVKRCWHLAVEDIERDTLVRESLSVPGRTHRHHAGGHPAAELTPTAQSRLSFRPHAQSSLLHRSGALY